VGWRAKEKHFLKMVFENTSWGAGLRCIAVAESKAASQATLTELNSAGIQGRFDTADDGFTRFAINRVAYSFLMQ